MEEKGVYKIDKKNLEENAQLEKAVHFATECHSGQTRKGTTLPFIVHPLEVMQILLGMNADTNLLIAGLLHDVVEDTDTTIEEIREQFGEDVAMLVAGHTEDKSKTWEERKSTEIKETVDAPLRLKKLVLADKLANMRSIHKNYKEIGNALWSRFNAGAHKQAWYYGEMTESLADMQEYSEAALYYWEFLGLYKDVFVVYFLDEKNEVLYQDSMIGEAYCLHKGSPEWLILADVIPEDVIVVNRKYAENLEEVWNQSFWDVIEEDLSQGSYDLFSNTELSYWITIAERQLIFHGELYGETARERFGKDVDFHDALSEEGTYQLLTLLRVKYGSALSLEEIFCQEFGAEDGSFRFNTYCTANEIQIESIVI